MDYSKSINEQVLLPETKVILSLIYRDYICNLEKKKELLQKDTKECRQNEDNKRYDYNDIFKNQKIKSKNNKKREESTNYMVEYKDSLIKRILKKIKIFFKNHSKNIH